MTESVGGSARLKYASSFRLRFSVDRGTIGKSMSEVLRGGRVEEGVAKEVGSDSKPRLVLLPRDSSIRTREDENL